MFILISVLLSFSVLISLMYLSKQRDSTFSRKYDVIVILREILLLVRQCRSHTHQSIALNKDLSNEIQDIVTQLDIKSNQLIASSAIEYKANYRVFQLMLKSLTRDWQQRTIARNQMVHGKAIRHCLFLIDEIIITWLVEAGREDLSTEYHQNWHQVSDSMEVLTQFRISIQDINSTEGYERSKYYCNKLRQKDQSTFNYLATNLNLSCM